MREININNYSKLSSIERTNLTISSLTRGDFKEADRLWESCPKFTYVSIDLNYTIGLMAINHIKSIFFSECVYIYNHLIEVDNEILINKIIEMHSSNENFKSCDKLYDIKNSYIKNLNALFEGFSAFCCYVGLNNDHLLAMIHIDDVCLDINLYLDSENELDSKDIEVVKNMFLECWNF